LMQAYGRSLLHPTSSHWPLLALLLPRFFLITQL